MAETAALFEVAHVIISMITAVVGRAADSDRAARFAR